MSEIQPPQSPPLDDDADDAGHNDALLVEASPEASTSTGTKVARAAGIVGVLQVVRSAIGFVSKPLIANRLGLGAEADVYTIAADIVTSLWRIYEKAINPAFLPLFARAIGEEGEERAWRFASGALCLTLALALVVTPFMWWIMPGVVAIYSQKAGMAQQAQTVAIARLMLLGLAMLMLSSLTYVILNGYKRFTAAALGDTTWKAGIALAALGAIVLAAPPEASLYLLSWGFVLGAAFKLLPQLIALRGKWPLFRVRLDFSDPLIRRMLLLGVPLLVGILTSEGRDVYNKWLADSPLILNAAGRQIAGSRAALDFSRNIGSNLINIFPYALSIGIFPYLADLTRERDHQPLTDILMGALRACLFVFLPLSAILIALRFQLLRGVFESGQFTRDDTIVVAAPFLWFTLGLSAFACESILNQTYYARTDVWTPTFIGLGTTVLWIAAATFGVQQGWGLAAIAGAETLAKTTKCLMLWALLRRHLANVHTRDNLLFVAKVLVLSLMSAFVASVLARFLVPGDAGKGRQLLGLLLSCGGGALLFGITSALLHIPEMRAVLAFAGRLKNRTGRA